MNPTLLVTLVLVAVVACLLLGLLVALARERARSRALLEQTRAEAAELRERLDALSVQVAAARESAQKTAQPEEYVITHLGEDDDLDTLAGARYSTTGDEADAVQRIDGRLFADIVLRESVVKAASLGHGVRRALAPETRNRIRFEMKREVKARRKGRKDEVRRVRRAMQDQRRTATT